MDQGHKTGAGIAGLAVAIGAVAFGSFLSHRHRRRGRDDAPDYARRNPGGEMASVGRTLTIRHSRYELYDFWRDFSNLPKFMENLEEVRSQESDGASTWRIKAPGGKIVDVETKVVDEQKGERIAWESVEGSDIRTRGEVRFEDAPGDRGTRVSLILDYDPPAGALGRTVAKLFMREPQVQARHDLKRFKMLMETGEISTSARTADQSRKAQQENG